MNISHLKASTFTNSEFERIVRSGGFGDARVELRRGLILKMNAQYASHANTKWLLALAIDEALRVAKLTWIVRSEVSVSLVEGFEPLPDIVVWDTQIAPADFYGPIPAKAVRLIVEVADTTLSDDLGEKLEDYAASGVAEYWVADVKGRIIMRHCDPSATGYARRQPVSFGQTFESLTHPSLRIDTAKLA
jgi:Uma2 family endonuclease